MPEAEENGTEGFQELIGEGEGVYRDPVSKRCLLVQPPSESHTTRRDLKQDGDATEWPRQDGILSLSNFTPLNGATQVLLKCKSGAQTGGCGVTIRKPPVSLLSRSQQGTKAPPDGRERQRETDREKGGSYREKQEGERDRETDREHFLPKRSHLLIFPKEFNQLGTKHSNMRL